MGQVRHGSATTTHAVRAATERSQSSLRRQADPRPNLLRGCETARIIDRRSAGQCHDRANPGHRDEAQTDRIVIGQLEDMAFKACQFSP